ncbi:MAG: sulfite exporter TauE/SafE family protein [Alphaproteobacteria bacterium]|nr:sulfite exporter TauE/SafE family protein [Alphaproteobacteria bacterium]
MEIYLPIAQMSVHWLVLLGLGGAIGFLSGLLGVGGGFLLTPLLIFTGIPSAVAVATTSSHVTASSMSGALAQWRKGAIDLKMAAVMTLGGIAGTFAGVWLFAVLRRSGQMDVFISAAYVVLLGTIGGLMLRESLGALRAARSGGSTPRRAERPWIHTLPFKQRFPASGLYISVIPPVAIGFAVGMLSTVLGVGGGFVIVPAMIYILRIPANVVMGTSLAQIIVITAAATVLQATNNHAVDAMLAAWLIVGGVIGAQLGVRAGARLRGEQLRMLLALLVLGVAIRLLYGLVATPRELFSVSGS